MVGLGGASVVSLAGVANAITNVNAFAASAAAFSAPSGAALSRVNAGTYNDLLQQLSGVNEQVSVWLSGLGPALTSVPQIYTNTGLLVLDFLGEAIGAAQTLQQDPSNQQAAAQLKASLQTLLQSLTPLADSLNDLQQRVGAFAGGIGSAVSGLNNSLDDIQQLYGDLSADQSQISAALTDLQNKIASLNAIITETEVGTAFTVGSQIIRIPAVWSWNPVLGCALLVCAIVCDSMQIAVEVGLRDDVAGLVKAVQGLTDAQTADGQAIASLNSAGQQLQLLLSQVKALSDQGGPLTQIRDTLASLAMDSQESVSSILAAQNEQQIASLISDLQSAEAAWNEAASVAQNFQENLTIEVNTATMLVYHDGKVDEVPA